MTSSRPVGRRKPRTDTSPLSDVGRRLAGALLQVVVVPAPLDHWALDVIPLGSLRGCCNWLPSDHRIVPEDTIATFDINVNTPHRRAPRSVVSNGLDRGIDT
jgi:hypothetical protein